MQRAALHIPRHYSVCTSVHATAVKCRTGAFLFGTLPLRTSAMPRWSRACASPMSHRQYRDAVAGCGSRMGPCPRLALALAVVFSLVLPVASDSGRGSAGAY